MGKYTVLPFKESHTWALVAPALSTPELTRRLYEGSPGWSVFHGGTFIGAAGIAIPYAGLGEAWAILGPDARKHMLFFHRAVKRTMLDLVKTLKLRRLQCTVLADFQAGHRYVEALGFAPECLLRAYGPRGEDFWQYVMFPGG